MRLARLRFIAFVPPAMLIASGILFSATTFVSALETRMVSDPIHVVEFRRVDSECDSVSRTMRDLSQAMMGCRSGSTGGSRLAPEPGLSCPGSPFVCSISTPDVGPLEADESRPPVFLF